MTLVFKCLIEILDLTNLTNETLSIFRRREYFLKMVDGTGLWEGQRRGMGGEGWGGMSTHEDAPT